MLLNVNQGHSIYDQIVDFLIFIHCRILEIELYFLALSLLLSGEIP